ncbi:unnamed protein product [Closterium sp. NIES-65]|nr:unnamed protein product [Closterium sp. NIES-65]
MAIQLTQMPLAPRALRLPSPPGTPAGRTTKVVEAQEGRHTATVVWLHGLGDSGDGIPDWLNGVWGTESDGYLLDLPHVKWIFPTALEAPVSVNLGHRSRSCESFVYTVLSGFVTFSASSKPVSPLAIAPVPVSPLCTPCSHAPSL